MADSAAILDGMNLAIFVLLMIITPILYINNIKIDQVVSKEMLIANIIALVS